MDDMLLTSGLFCFAVPRPFGLEHANQTIDTTREIADHDTSAPQVSCAQRSKSGATNAKKIISTAETMMNSDEMPKW